MVKMIDLAYFSSSAAFAIDENASVVAWNSYAESLVGYIEDEAIGRQCSEMLKASCLTGEPFCSAFCEGKRCFYHGQTYSSSVCRIRHKSGRLIAVNLSTLVLPEEERSGTSESAIAVIFLHKNLEFSESSLHVPLRIFTLGQFHLTVAGNGLAVNEWKRKQALVVLKYLIVNAGRPVHRERLIEILWPEIERDRGWKRLKVAISFLRIQLRLSGLPDEVVLTVDKSYLMREDAIWLDAVEFQNRVETGILWEQQEQPEKAVLCYEDANRLYQGDFLEGDLYEEWCIPERQRLHELYFDMLLHQARCRAMLDQYEEAVQLCWAALRHDPAREDFVRDLFKYLSCLDRREAALRPVEKWNSFISDDTRSQLTQE